jgi:hypothetical protein
MPEQKKINTPARPEEVEKDPLHDEDDLYDVVHKTEVTVCFVKGSDAGERVYGLYIEDSEGLKKPIGIELSIWPDGSVHVGAEGNPLEILAILKPELEEQLEREQEEEHRRKRAAKQDTNA